MDRSRDSITVAGGRLSKNITRPLRAWRPARPFLPFWNATIHCRN